MIVVDLLEKAQFLVDKSGHRKAILLEYNVWEALLTYLEDLEDAEEIAHLRESGEETISWQQAKAKLRAEDVLERPHPPTPFPGICLCVSRKYNGLDEREQGAPSNY